MTPTRRYYPVKRQVIQQPDDPTICHIPLTNGYFTVVDATEYERVSRYTWFAQLYWRKDGSIKYVYAYHKYRTATGLATWSLHRFITGVSDPLIKVDHWDRYGLNNRRLNLRVANKSQNGGNSNKSIANTSGFKGVSWHEHTKKWVAQICINSKRIHLGLFSTPEAAACVYDAAAIAHFGEFACLNFPRRAF